MERTKNISKAVTEVSAAGELIDYARNVLLAYQLTSERVCKPDLLPVVEYLLTQASYGHLDEAKRVLKDSKLR